MLIHTQLAAEARGTFVNACFSPEPLQMNKVEGDNWWMGLHSYENDGRFRWSDHSVLNYVSWALGRPHPLSRDRKCVYMSASKGESGTRPDKARPDLTRPKTGLTRPVQA